MRRWMAAALAVSLMSCKEPTVAGSPDTLAADIAGNWFFLHVVNGGVALGTWEAVLRLADSDGRVNGLRTHGTVEVMTSFGTQTRALPDVPIEGRVTGSDISLVFDVSGGGLDTLRATVQGGRMQGTTGWSASRMFGEPIDEARVRSGDTVSVSGVVIVDQNAIRLQRDLTYVVDRFGGIEVFGLDTALSLVEGDSVEVTGVAATFAGEPQIVPPSGGRLQVRRVGTGRVPRPRFFLDLSSLMAQWPGHVGTLVRTYATVRGTAPLANGAYSVLVGAGTGEPIVYVGAALAQALPALCWGSGVRREFIGVLGSFGGQPQLQLRRPQDAGFPANGCSVAEPVRH